MERKSLEDIFGTPNKRKSLEEISNLSDKDKIAYYEERLEAVKTLVDSLRRYQKEIADDTGETKSLRALLWIYKR